MYWLVQWASSRYTYSQGESSQNHDRVFQLMSLSRFYMSTDESGFPDLSTRESWYNDVLLAKSKDKKTAVSYESQAKAVKDALDYAEVNTSVSTHINRATGARLADQGGAAHSDVERLGQWMSQAVDVHYLSRFPRTAMRAVADFPPAGGSFFLPRAIVVPSSLLHQFFPEIERW